MALKEIDAHIRHEAVSVPPANCPFNQETLLLFENGLKLLTESGDLPPGYGVTPDELDGGVFDEEEEIKIGLRRKGNMIQLPRSVWQSRTEIWAQGLFVMSSILASLN